ncbi:hypothetical protein [Aliamphritea spongicola]|nr:hypothetical protein [Aliamphritea spongicola]
MSGSGRYIPAFLYRRAFTETFHVGDNILKVAELCYFTGFVETFDGLQPGAMAISAMEKSPAIHS